MQQSVMEVPYLDCENGVQANGEVEAILARLGGGLAQINAAIDRPGFRATEDIESTVADKAMVASQIHTKIMSMSWSQQGDAAL